MENQVKFDERNIEMDKYNMPINFSLDEIVRDVTEGPGFFVIKNMFSEEDLKLAQDKVLSQLRVNQDINGKDFKHSLVDQNNYSGLLWV